MIYFNNIVYVPAYASVRLVFPLQLYYYTPYAPSSASYCSTTRSDLYANTNSHLYYYLLRSHNIIYRHYTHTYAVLVGPYFFLCVIRMGPKIM